MRTYKEIVKNYILIYEKTCKIYVEIVVERVYTRTIADTKRKNGNSKSYEGSL